MCKLSTQNAIRQIWIAKLSERCFFAVKSCSSHLQLNIDWLTGTSPACPTQIVAPGRLLSSITISHVSVCTFRGITICTFPAQPWSEDLFSQTCPIHLFGGRPVTLPRKPTYRRTVLSDRYGGVGGKPIWMIGSIDANPRMKSQIDKSDRDINFCLVLFGSNDSDHHSSLAWCGLLSVSSYF